MIGADLVATVAVDRQVKRIADGDRPLLDPGAMRKDAAEILLRVLDDAANAMLVGDRPGISDLPAALGIEGRLVDDDFDRLAGFGAVDADAVLDQRDDLSLAFLGRNSR